MKELNEVELSGKLNVTTIVPYVGKPVLREYLMSARELARFLNPDRDFAEFVISIKYNGDQA